VVGDREVRVTQPRGANLNENLAAHRGGDVDVIEVEPAADGVENESFHDPEDALVLGASLVKRCQGSIKVPRRP
jgi:hypothetical protein